MRRRPNPGTPQSLGVGGDLDNNAKPTTVKDFVVLLFVGVVLMVLWTVHGNSQGLQMANSGLRGAGDRER